MEHSGSGGGEGVVVPEAGAGLGGRTAQVEGASKKVLSSVLAEGMLSRTLHSLTGIGPPPGTSVL